jgi:hypothetical protein
MVAISARLIAIANALEGTDRASAARVAGMDRQTLRDWVHRYSKIRAVQSASAWMQAEAERIADGGIESDVQRQIAITVVVAVKEAPLAILGGGTSAPAARGPAFEGQLPVSGPA